MKKLLMGCLCVLMLGACSKPTENEGLIVGFDNTFAPMGFLSSEGEVVGFDVDIAKEVGLLINEEFIFQNVDWDLKETELNAGNIDLIWNGYSITEERKNQVLFSDPYLGNTQIIITLIDSTVDSKADLAGEVIAVQRNTSALDAVNKEVDFVEALDSGKAVQLETNNDCFMELEAGRADAIVVDEVLARYYMKQKGENLYKVLEDSFGNEEYAIGLRKSDTDLCKKINDALETLKNNGKFDEIKAKWFSE